jgi:hypothetical protein
MVSVTSTSVTDLEEPLIRLESWIGAFSVMPGRYAGTKDLVDAEVFARSFTG